MDPESRSVQLEFPHYCTVLLESLNKHRLEGKFCDIAIHVQSRIFQAHKSVLAASSPYFHDKLLLNDASHIVLPSVIEPDTFENLLQLIYSGCLKVQPEALPSHLLVASGLQMWQVVDRCLEILKERAPYRPWSSRASESQSPSSSNYFGQRDEGESGAAEMPSKSGGSSSSGSELSAHPSVECPEDEVIKIQVSHKEEEEEEEEEDDRVQICSGSLDKSVKIILEEAEESNMASTSYKSPSLQFSSSAGAEQECFSARDTKIFYIKQERFEQDEGISTPIHDTHFMKSLTQGRSLGVTEVQALYQTEYQGGEVSYIIPAPADGPLGFAGKMADEGVFPQVISKPVDLHGNEIVAHAVHGQAVHAPVKIMAAPDGKKFGCLCGKRFAVKPKRDRHIMLTFSLRPFGCSVCNKKFKLKHHLTEHMKTHDGTLYSCDDCGRKFRVQNCYLKHKELCKGQGWSTACWTYK
ncbi:zinc finger and BTB domain-containing protein 9 [Rhinatrema bivittatum]|uniref:zinc finger and BTB domain-containing protein 9 n=1 Tax=Rhinatrema bivittatum TaxID=194408 RepID=UPI0011296485|nr:zinc finger and BTB domain-containing protein 9 [Rhinatrema bivittatum]